MKTMLLEVNLDTGELITVDGEKYLVDPEDLPTCCAWTPTAEVEIYGSKEYIKNLECDVTIGML